LQSTDLGREPAAEIRESSEIPEPFSLPESSDEVRRLSWVQMQLVAAFAALEIKGVAPLIIAGVIGLFLDSVLGLTPPVLEDASVRSARSERAARVGAVSERLRVMQLFGILLQYTVDLV
jgi:hypothetical protein